METYRNIIASDHCGHKPDSINVLATAQCERGKRKRADDGYPRPQQHGRDLVHDTSWIGPRLESAFPRSTANGVAHPIIVWRPPPSRFSNLQISLYPRLRTDKACRRSVPA